MISCAVYGCTNNTTSNVNPNIQYYYFPKQPSITQQWITACWRADPIDINTARICSIHFDDSCYSSEYKLLNYLGHYTRILKYDAIPNLYLPNTQAPVMLNQPINDLNDNGVKDELIYEAHPGDIDVQKAIDEHLLGSSEVKPEESALSKTDKEEYKRIQTNEQLEQIRNENVMLRQKIGKLEKNIKHARMKLSQKQMELKLTDEEMKKRMHQHAMIRSMKMTSLEQTNILAKVFSEPQIKILSGKKKIYWSNDDMAMGYTIRHLGNKRCYMYLTKHLKIPLPALSSIRRWATLKKNEFDQKQKSKSEDDYSS